MSVAALVALGRLPQGDRGEAQVAAALAAMDLAAGRPPGLALSGGERARALLARVLAGGPLDPRRRAARRARPRSPLALLATCASRRCGAGVVLVLHDLALAMNHADRVLVLDRGALVADGPPEQALAEAIDRAGLGRRARWLGEPGAGRWWRGSLLFDTTPGERRASAFAGARSLRVAPIGAADDFLEAQYSSALMVLDARVARLGCARRN